MDHDIEVSEFRLGTETPSAFHLITFATIGEENITQPTKWNKTKQNQRHLRGSLSWRLERDTIGYRKKLNEQITRQIFINHVVYLGAQDTQ